MHRATLIVLALTAAALAAGLGPVLWLGLHEGVMRGAIFDGYLLHVALFTLKQAALSTALSILPAIALARALNGAQFPGRRLALALLAVPLGLPAIVAILGLIAVFGKTGPLPLNLYGLTGILIAHVFFNLPLATRFFLERLEAIPPESWRLAAQLDFDGWSRFRQIEWPALRTALPAVALLIFLLCAASFAVVLTLGGGPAATTLEVAIYQALRFDFDPARAGVLAAVQLAVCLGLVLVASLLAVKISAWSSNAPRTLLRRRASAVDLAVIIPALAFVAAPLAAIAINGVTASFAWGAIAAALATSLAIAATSSALSLLLAWPLALEAARPHGRLVTALLANAALAALVVPPAVLATGWFLLWHNWPVAPLLVIAMNALMALPFALSALSPAVKAQSQRYDRLCQSLGLEGLQRFRLIDLPVLKRPLGLAAALSAIASLGDLTAIALFGSQNFTTLPALIYRQMGSYRIDAAMASALVLALLALAITLAAQRWSQTDDRA